jgi:hypothetical protein
MTVYCFELSSVETLLISVQQSLYGDVEPHKDSIKQPGITFIYVNSKSKTGGKMRVLDQATSARMADELAKTYNHMLINSISPGDRNHQAGINIKMCGEPLEIKVTHPEDDKCVIKFHSSNDTGYDLQLNMSINDDIYYRYHNLVSEQLHNYDKQKKLDAYDRYKITTKAKTIEAQNKRQKLL